LQQQKESSSSEMLQEIKDNSVSLMERMDDIVWSINPKNDSLESLFLRIKIFAAKLFEAKEIDYNISISDAVRQTHLPMEYRQHIYLIMKEAINNLVKYSNCSKAELNVSLHSSQLHVFIQDNGKGFNPAKSNTGNGLNSMSQRAKEINAVLKIDSKKDEGTSIDLFVKIK